MSKNLTSSEIRTKFLDYFETNGHTKISSSSLVPINDPTLLFTNAGMVQFKDVFLGKEILRDKNGDPIKRAVTCQRCVRAGGKHNDLENVGYTTRHHTFFEMLGNFSFGDYFKKDAIHYAWDFLTNKEKGLGIPPERLLVTVHEKDSEAAEIWKKEFAATHTLPQGGIEQGIICCGDKDNFWAMGETGPCGYCSEIFYDHDPSGELGLSGGKPGESNEGGDCYVEIWNLVFMQFERDAKGNLTPLPRPSVDTGMGLERIAAVMQSVYDNYDIDIFKKLTKAFELNWKKIESINSQNQKDFQNKLKFTIRVINDHIRSAAFLIADGVIPSNEGRGYTLRGIIRRAIYHLYDIGIRKSYFYSFVPTLIEEMSDVYPELELKTIQENIQEILKREEIQFLETLERGVKILNQEINQLIKKNEKIIPGITAFTLHDTYGFPIVLTTEIAKKRGFQVDQTSFETEMEKQRERSRAASKFTVQNDLKINISGETEFVGYTNNSCESTIIAIFDGNGDPCEFLKTDEEGIIILDKTPFYAESGGQVGDVGYLESNEKFIFQVNDTIKHGKLFLHKGCVECGTFKENQIIEARISIEKRNATRLNHSSAHLLHKALQIVLGEQATQRGSYIDSKRLRFDFAHFETLSTTDLQRLEQIVNTAIRANYEIITSIASIEEARKMGAIALFGEKYGDKVRVIKIADFSMELCGGTHVKRTGDIGLFKIISESGVASGTRRIEAMTGENALEWINQGEDELQQAMKLLSANRDQVAQKIQQLFTKQRVLEKELTQIKSSLAADKGNDLAMQAQQINGINVLAAKLDNVDAKTLRQTLDTLKDKLKPAVIILATENSGKIQLVSGVSKNICEKYKANELLQYVAKQIDGTGGGRPDMAQGGGTNVAALDKALQAVTNWVRTFN